MKFYYTFGSNADGKSSQPFSLGHVIVHARNQWEANQKFQKLYPHSDPRSINCAGYYNQHEMEETGMLNPESPWAFCHKEIV